MWKQIQESPPYYFKFLEENDRLSVFITDFIKLWFCSTSKNEFKLLLQKSNPRLVFDDENELTQLGIQALKCVDLKKLQLAQENDGQLVDITMTLSAVYSDSENPLLLRYKNLLKKSCDKMFYEIVTKPLFKIVTDLKSSQDELIKLLLKKDKAIMDFKSKAGDILFESSKSLEFHKDNHLKAHKTFDDTFGAVEIPKELLEKPFTMPPLPREIKQEEPTADTVMVASRRYDDLIEFGMMKCEAEDDRSKQLILSQAGKDLQEDLKLEFDLKRTLKKESERKSGEPSRSGRGKKMKFDY